MLTRRIFKMITRLSRFIGLTTCLFLCCFAIAADNKTPIYKFVAQDKFHACISRGNDFLVGYVDRRGDFVVEKRYESAAFLSGVGNLLNIGSIVGRDVYEFRSGRLIPGKLTDDGYFIPKVDSRIIDFKDYVYSPTATPIWNLPGRFELVQPVSDVGEPKK